MEDSTRELYWSKITFISTDEAKRSTVYASGSREYFAHDGDKAYKKNLSSWLNKVVDKWKSLGQRIFDQDVHYDVYSETPEGEANGLDFLLRKVQSS